MKRLTKFSLLSLIALLGSGCQTTQQVRHQPTNPAKPKQTSEQIISARISEKLNSIPENGCDFYGFNFQSTVSEFLDKHMVNMVWGSDKDGAGKGDFNTFLITTFKESNGIKQIADIHYHKFGETPETTRPIKVEITFISKDIEKIRMAQEWLKQNQNKYFGGEHYSLDIAKFLTVEQFKESYSSYKFNDYKFKKQMVSNCIAKIDFLNGGYEQIPKYGYFIKITAYSREYERIKEEFKAETFKEF